MKTKTSAAGHATKHSSRFRKRLEHFRQTIRERGCLPVCCSLFLLVSSACSPTGQPRNQEADRAPSQNQPFPLSPDARATKPGQPFSSEPIAETIQVTMQLPPGWSESQALEPVLVGSADGVVAGADSAGATPHFRVSAYAKRLPQFPGSARVDLIIENLSSDVLRGIELNLQDSTHPLIETTNAPFSTEPSTSFRLRGLGARGLGRIILRVPSVVADEPAAISFAATVSAQTAQGESTSSSPIAITQDGSEVWIPFADGNSVSIIETTNHTEAGRIQVDEHPSAVVFAGADRFALVASAHSNTVSVFERTTRRVVQTLTEADGLGRELRHMVAAPDGQSVFVSGYVSDTLSWIRLRAPADDTENSNTEPPFEVVQTVSVGRRPSGLSVSADGSQILIAHFLPRGPISDNEAWVSMVRPNAESSGFEQAGEVVYRDTFNVKESSCLAKRFGNRASPEQLSGEGVLSELAGVYLDPGSNQAWVPAMKVPGIVPLIEIGAQHKPISDTVMPDVKGEFFGALNVGLDTRNPESTTYLRSQGVLDMDDVDQEYIRCADLPEEMEFGTFIRDPELERTQRVLMKGVNLPSGVTQLEPTAPLRALAYTQAGRALAMVSFGSDELALANATTHHPLSRRHFLLPGSNPNGIAISPDGQTAYVVYENSPFLTILDVSAYSLKDKGNGGDAHLTAELGAHYVPYRFNGEPQYLRGGGVLTRKRVERDVSQLPEFPNVRLIKNVELSDTDPMDSRLRRGKILFSSTNPLKHPNLTASKLVSCAGCHPDGGSDGSAWSTVEGERRTMSLRGGVAGRGWLHASATHKDSEEFASIIVRERMGGDLPASDVEALARYVSFGIPRLQTPAVDSRQAERGKQIFESSCRGCHSGPQYGSGNAQPGHPLGGSTAERRPTLFDIGTAVDRMLVGRPQFFSALRRDAPESAIIDLLWGDRELGQNDPVQSYLDFTPRPDRPRGSFKAPALTNVWDNVLFFHDGRFTNLKDVIGFFNDRMSLGLSDADALALEAYLRTL